MTLLGKIIRNIVSGYHQRLAHGRILARHQMGYKSTYHGGDMVPTSRLVELIAQDKSNGMMRATTLQDVVKGKAHITTGLGRLKFCHTLTLKGRFWMYIAAIKGAGGK